MRYLWLAVFLVGCSPVMVTDLGGRWVIENGNPRVNLLCPAALEAKRRGCDSFRYFSVPNRTSKQALGFECNGYKKVDIVLHGCK